ncbi:hypothetical protein [Rhodoferax sp.]|uniref:hypothetical protein n=1 Tax=Rhodoferax sp. TaxID=50421 RepID=UPI00374D6170
MKLRPVPQQPVIDGLAYILAWSCGLFEEQEATLKKIRGRIKKLIAAGTCERAYPQGSRYRENFRILLSGGSPALVQIGAVDTLRQKGGIRIACNPAKFQPGDTKKIHRVMRSLIGREEYNDLMKRPLLNVIHVAVDIHHASLTQMLVHYKNGQRLTMFAKRFDTDGHIEGYNFGSLDSDYQTTAYDKDQQLVHAAILAIAQSGKSGFGEDPLKANKIKQLETLIDGVEIVRIEVRGKKMRGLPLWKLPQQTNRFARFQLADLGGSGISLDPLTEKAFLAMCRQNGVKAALDAFKHTKQARKVNAFWRGRQVTWWQPESLWQQACDAVRESCLFPPEAFDALD